MPLKVKNLFFDRTTVTNRIGKAKARALSMIGRFIQVRARGTLRTRKRTSKPGEPPSMHIGTIKRLLFYSLDPIRDSVVIGPEVVTAIGPQPPEPVPGALEHGGMIAFNATEDVRGKISIDRSDARRNASPFKYVPVWKASDTDREDSIGIFTKIVQHSKRKRHAMNFYTIRKPQPRRIVKAVAKRPFMLPALEHERKNPKLAAVWHNSIVRV